MRFTKYLLFLLFITASLCGEAQDGNRLQISLLTCEQGNELYSTFGHSALRIIDSNAVTDKVYNYGTFNFYEKGFYIKFVKGKLKYYVDVEDFQDFKTSYMGDNRSITEQVLSLSPKAKYQLQEALNENLIEENKYYLYNFFLDNCTTRVRDLIMKYQQPAPILPAVMPAGSSFRDAVHQSHKKSNSPWIKFGMDIMLGANADENMTIAQQQFLPDNLMNAFDKVENVKIISSTSQIFIKKTEQIGFIIFTPFVVFSAVLILFLVLHFFNNNIAKNLLTSLDFILIFLSGLLGTMLSILWAITDHTTLQNNYNILWAWPTHLIIAFFVRSQFKWVYTYRILASIFLILFLMSATFLAQSFNAAIIPLVVLLAWRLFPKKI